MGLSIYPDTTGNGVFSQNGTNTNPIRFAIDGRVGGVLERLYYVRNDSATKTYSSVTVIPTPNIAADIVSGTDGYSIKLKAGSTQPTAQEWDTIDPGDTITLSNISNTLTYLPFWARIEIPKGAPVDTITNTFLTINCVETSI